MQATPAPDRPASGREKRLFKAQAALILAVHFGLLFFTALEKSATSDEPFHLARGISAVFTGDFRMSVAHPPLINAITAAPLWFRFDFGFLGRSELWLNERLHHARRKEVLASQLHKPLTPERYLEMILLSRIPVMLMSVALGALVWSSARKLWGERAGMAALALYAFSPTVLAHGMLNTTDLGCALFMFIFALALCRHLRRPSRGALLVCGASFGLCLLTKHTAILLAPLIPVALVWSGEGSLREKLGRFFTLRPVKPEFLTGVMGWVLIMLMGAAVLWAGYGFEFRSIHRLEPPSEFAGLGRPDLLLKQIAVWVMASVPLPPRTYYFGLATTLLDTAQHAHPLYFLGRESDKGWWYYYPALFLLKEPLSLFGLIALGLALARRPAGTPRSAGAVMAVFGFGILFFFMFLNQKNIGLRHLLPAYPFLFLWVSRTAVAASPRRWARSAFWCLLAIYSVNGVISCPDYLTHFNRAVGGPAGGLRYSVVGEDWGQDLKALGRFCQERGIEEIHYQPYGFAWPEAYGIPRLPPDCQSPEPGWYAFHLVDLRRPRGSQGRECAEKFSSQTPAAVLRHTIYVFRVEEPDADAAPRP